MAENHEHKKTTIIPMLVALVIAIGWAWGVFSPPSRAGAVAKFEPLDAGQQRQALIKEQQKTNARLEELIRLLKSGKVRVVATPPGQAGRKAGR